MLELRDRDLIRWCGERGTGVLSYSPLAFGLLTGAIGLESRFDRDDVRAGRDEGSLFAPGNRESGTSPSSRRCVPSRTGSASRSLSSRSPGTCTSRA
jgi:aryl-alcohol dehydrogenase-like predicted oxidoreductase